MGLDEIFDRIQDEWDYLISFEWFEDVKDFFSGLFENISEFSLIGLIYGIIMVFLVYLLRKKVFVFVETLDPVTKIILYPLFYIFAFIIGYIMGRRIWE